MSNEKDKSMTIENGDDSTLYSDLAGQAVKLVLGTNNEYLQKLLANQLEGKVKKYKSVPITEIIRKPDREPIKTELTQSIETAKSAAVGFIKEQIASGTQTPPDPTNLQTTANWIINSLLHEKLNYREVRESSDKWKTINGILATVLPIVVPVITGFIQYYLTNNSDSPCSC